MRLQASKANGGLRTSSLTRDFKETVNVRIERDPAFRHILLKVGVEWLLAGDVEAGKSILRIHVVAQWTGRPAFKLRPDGTQGLPGRRCGTANPVDEIGDGGPPIRVNFPVYCASRRARTAVPPVRIGNRQKTPVRFWRPAPAKRSKFALVGQRGPILFLCNAQASAHRRKRLWYSPVRFVTSACPPPSSLVNA